MNNRCKNPAAEKQVQEIICPESDWGSAEKSRADICFKVDWVQLKPDGTSVTWGQRHRPNRKSIYDVTFRAYRTKNDVEWVSMLKGVGPDMNAYYTTHDGSLTALWVVDTRLLMDSPEILFNPCGWNPNYDEKGTGFVYYTAKKLGPTLKKVWSASDRKTVAPIAIPAQTQLALEQG